ncbi:MAG: NUDIX hydrolase, partial [Eubacteriales bacterium]|nr:NUDIX hydrolase [Eubacteriales bacterium]
MTQDAELRETPLSEQQVFHGVLIDVSHMQVRLPDGREALREIVHHKGAAAIVPVDGDGNVTLVRQHRVAIGQVTLEIPAGKFEVDNEDPLDCARRELEEETGLRAGRMEFLTPMLSSPGFCTECVNLFLARDLTQHRRHLDEDEFLNVVRMPLSEALDRAMAGEFCDGKTALGLLMAAEKIRREQ